MEVYILQLVGVDQNNSYLLDKNHLDSQLFFKLKINPLYFNNQIPLLMLAMITNCFDIFLFFEYRFSSKFINNLHKNENFAMF